MNDQYFVAVIDDDVEMLRMIAKFLTRQNYTVETFSHSDAALREVQRQHYHVVISDVRMPGVSGIDILQAVQKYSSGTIVIIITAFGTVTSAVEAMRLGAFDYISKPFNMDELIVVLNKAIEQYRLQEELQSLRKAVQTRYSFSNILGRSPAMQKIFDTIERVTNTKSNVLIQGKTGTGKELIARALHFNSNRKQHPFLAVNCGAIPATLLESELFGHERGAYTDAVTREVGLIVQADHGTIFLDEIGDMPMQMQAKLLRVLEDWEVRPVGGTVSTRVDVRVVAATNKSLEAAVDRGEFREDLYFRLNVINIAVPELKERQEDIPLLINHFLRKARMEMGKPTVELSKYAFVALMNYSYPGNVRELENIIAHAMLLTDATTIEVKHLPTSVSEDKAKQHIDGSVDGHVSLQQLEKMYIQKVLNDVSWHRTKAAQILGIDRRTLYRKIQEFDLLK